MKFHPYSQYCKQHFVIVLLLLSLFTGLTSTVNAQPAVNQPPVINGISSQSIQEGQLISLTISYSDPDGNPLTRTISSDNPEIASVAEMNANTLTIVGSRSGSATIMVTVDDGQGGSASTSFIVTVTAAPTVVPPNQSPIIVAMTDLTMQVGQTVSIPVSINDPDGNATTFTVASDNPSIANAAADNNIFLTITGIGAGTAHIVVTVNDGVGGTASTSFAVTVNGVPTVTPMPTDAPTLIPISTDIPATGVIVEPITATPVDAATLPATDLMTPTDVGTLTGTIHPTDLPQPTATITADIPMTSIIVRTAIGLVLDQQKQVIVRNGGVETSSVPVLRLHFIDVPTARVNEILMSYRSDSLVVSVELDKSREAQTLPDGSGIQTNWQQFPKAVLFPNFLTQGSGSALAILDTGVNASLLNGSVLPGYSTFEGSDPLSDPNGHGTEMAGIALATAQGTNVQIMPVQVLDAEGNGQDSDIINGIVWATDNGANVILMAFSNPGYSSALQAAVDYAWSSNVILVAATGNDALSSATFPSGNVGVMGVSATDGNGGFAPFSNYGADTFIAAPGVNITIIDSNGGTTSATGTSASAANVAGAAAYIRALNPSYSNGVVIGKLARTTDAVGTQAQTGNGQINLARALSDSSTTPIKPLGASMMGSGGPFVGPYKAAAVSTATLAIKESTCTTDQSAFYTGYTVCASTYVTTSGSGNNLRMQWYNPSGTLVQDTALSGVSNATTLTNSLSLTSTSAVAGMWTVKTCATSTAGACSAANTKSTRTFTVITAIAPSVTVGTVVPSTNYLPTAGFVMSATGNSLTISMDITNVGNGDDSIREVTITTIPSAAKSPLAFQATGSSGSGGGVTWGTPTVINNTSNTSIILFPYTGTLTSGTLTFTISLAAITAYSADQTDSFTATVQRGTGGITSTLSASNSLKRYSLLITGITPPGTSATVGQIVSPVISVTNYSTGSITMTAANTSISGSGFKTVGTEGLISAISSGGSGTVTYTGAVISTAGGSQTVEGDAGKGTTVTAPHFSKTITVNPASLTLTLTGNTPSPSTVGQAYAVTFTYTVNSPGSGTPIGSVTVTDGTDSCTGTIASGTCNLTSTTAGTKSLTATYVTDGNYTGSTTAGRTHTVNKGTSTITWAAPTTITYGTALSAAQLNATASVPGTFVYTPALDTVLNAGSSQTLHVDFTPISTANYNTASKDVTITVNKGALTITADNKTNQYGTGLPTLTASYSGFVNGDTASSLDTAVILTTTTTLASSIGTYPITASAASDANYTVTFVAGTMTVTKREIIITVNSGVPNPSLVGQAYVVSWTTSITESGIGTPSGTVTVSDGSANCNATIATGSCSLTSTSAGSKTLTATYSNDTDFTTSSPSVSPHTVHKATPMITWAAPAAITYGATLSAAQLNATASAPGTFIYTPAFGTVLNAGSGQTLHVDFTPTDATNYNADFKDVTVDVEKADTVTVIFNAQPAASTVEQSYAVTWQVSRAEAGAGTPSGMVTISDGTDSCTASVASGTCNLTSATAGTKTLTATYSGDNNFNGSVSTSHSHNVDQAIPTLNWENPAAIPYGTALSATQLNAIASVAGTFVYTPAIGTLLDAGRGQNLHVDFTPADTANYATVSKDVSINVEASNIAISIQSAEPDTSVVGQIYTVTWVISTAGSGTPTGTVTVSDATDSCNAAVEVGSCNLVSTTTGMKLLLAVYSGDNGFASSVSTIHLHKVDPATPTITWSNPADITHGTMLSSTQLNASTSVPGTLVYTPPVGTLLNAGDGQTLHVDFTPTDAVNYLAVSKDVVINVNISSTSIELTNDLSTPTLVDAPYSVHWTLTVTAAGSSIPSGTVTVSDGTDSCSANIVSGQCQLTSSTAGAKTLVATYSGDVNFEGSTSSGYSHVVNQITPTINWANPAIITYGTALSTSELNASVLIPGTLVYTPAIGTVLNAGNEQTLHVDFTPIDTVNYASVSRDVTVNVRKAALTVTADNQTMVYGEAIPMFTVAYNGFVNGDNATNLDAPVSVSTSATAGSNAGSYPIEVSGAVDTNYDVSFVHSVLTVTPLTITVTADNLTKVYGEADPAFTYHSSPELLNAAQFIGKLSRDAGKDVGSYAITQGTLALNLNYSLVFVPGMLQINALGIAVNASPQSKVYSTVDPLFTYTYSPELVSGDLFTGKLIRTDGENAGQYTIDQGTLALNSNYVISYSSDSLTINPLAITVTADKLSKTYGDSDPALTYHFSPELLGSDTFTGTLSRSVGENVGSYNINQGSLALSPNYSVNYVNDTMTIKALAITVTANKLTKTYGDEDPRFTYAYIPELVIGDAFTGTLSRTTGEDVGGYAIAQGTLALSSNYDLIYKSAHLTIAPLTITVTADQLTKNYGETDPVLTYSFSPELLSGDRFSGTLTRATGNDVASYAIEQGSLALSYNYNLNYVSNDLTINPLVVTVMTEKLTKTYGETDPTLTYTFSPELVSGDRFSGALTRAIGNDVGNYAITQGTLALSNNYNLNYISNELVINPLTVSVIANTRVKTYGEADPALTYSYVPELVTGDVFSGTLTRAEGDDAGDYAITQGTLTLSNNYTLNYISNELVINPLEISVTANKLTKNYGETDPMLTYSFSPELIDGDTFNGALTRIVGNDVGNYAIEQGTLVLSNNYSLDYVGADLTVTPLTISVTADAQAKTYGQTDPALTYNFSPELVSGDVFSGGLTRAAGNDVGNYAIEQGTLKLSSNYTFNYTDSNLTINPLTINVIADKLTKNYGQTDPALTYNFSPELVSGDVFSGGLTRIVGNDVGNYAIEQGTLALNHNYTLNYTASDLTINPLTITVIANKHTKIYDQIDPALTYIYVPELVSGDVFSGGLTRAAGNDVGNYAITQGTLALNHNYNLNYISNDLFINPLIISVTADQQSKTYGETDPTLTYTSSPELVTDDSFSGNLSRIAGNDVGSYTIEKGTLALSSNYTLNYTASDLTIHPLTVTVTADVKTKTYGEVDPELTYSFSPELINGDSFSGNLSRVARNDVGDYTIKQGTLALSSNYTLNYTASDLTIHPLTVTVTADVKIKTYGEVDPELTYSFSPEPINGDSFSGALSRAVGNDVGDYAITQGTLALSSNYSVNYITNNLVVAPLTVTVTVDAKTKMLRESDPQLTYTFSPALINSDTFSGRLERTTGEAVGSYAIMQGTLELGSNYNLHYVSNDLKILFKAYNTAITLTHTTSGTSTVGQSYSVNWTVTTSATANTIPSGTVEVTDGSQSCSASIEIGSCNLTSTTVGTKMLVATFSGDSEFETSQSSGLSHIVEKATPTLNWDNPAAITYGTALSANELNAVPSIPGTLVYTPAQGTVLNAGQGQTLHVEFTPADSANYDPVSQDAVINVTKAALTITANDQITVYGSALPELTVTYSGFVNNDTSDSLDTPVTLHTSANTMNDIGTYPIEVGNAADANYEVTFIAAKLAVTPLTIMVNATAQTKTYTEADPILTYTYSPELLNGDTFSGELARTAGEDIGRYTIAQGTLAVSDNYHLNVVNAEMTINPLTVSVVANPITKTYGDSDPELTYTYNPELLNGDTFSGILARATGESVGTHTINQGTLTLNDNYSLDFVSADLTISPLTVSVVTDSLAKTYGNSDPALTYNFSPGLVAGDRFSGNLDRTIGEDIGNYAINQGTLALSDNYILAYVGGILTIDPLTITVSALPQSKTYGNTDPALTYNFSPGLVAGDRFSGNLSRTTGDDVGSYAINQGTLALSDNYSLNFAGNSLLINPLTIMVSALPQSKTYGDNDPTLTYSYSPKLITGDDFSGDLGRTTGENVGSYTINQGTLELSSNYTLNYFSNNMTVTKAVLTVAADNQARPYGDANPTLTVSYAGFKNADTFGTSVKGSPLVTTTATPLSLASGSPYTINVKSGTLASDNYNFTFVNGVLTILKVIVTANNQTRLYGDANPTLSVSYANLKTGQTFATSGITGSPICTTTATTASPVGTYPINCTNGTLASTNYRFTFVGGTMTINKAPLTITTSNRSRVYGASNPTFTTSYTGFKNGQNLVSSGITGSPLVTTTATETSTGSTMYPITLSLGTLASNNYSFTFVSGLLTITKAPLTVSSETKTRVFGDANPPLTVVYTNFKNGETIATSDITGQPTCTTLATPASSAGTYTITCLTGTLASRNYSFTMVNLGLTVTKAPLTVTVPNVSRVYGATNPIFTVSYSGFKNGQTLVTSGITGKPTLLTTATLSSPVSNSAYPITASLGTLVSSNYSFVLTTGSLTVTKAPLTMIVANATRIYGAANPTFTVTYSGFKNSQTLATSGISGSPVITTTATIISPVSTTPYPIIPTIGTLVSNNYSFVLVNGTLTITKAALSVTADAKTRFYGDANPTLTVSYIGLKNGETLETSGIIGKPICTTTATVTSAVAIYPITCTVGTLISGNYTLTLVKGSIAVTKAPLTITAANKSRPFGTANPVFTVTYSGFKNNQTLATSGVSGLPICKTTALTSSPAGTYPITCAAGTLVSTNYNFGFVGGMLLVQ